MDRVIKFRGKRIDNGEWVYGVPAYLSNMAYIVKLITLSGCVETFEFVKIDSKTVGQFIGLMDKNGTEVYESDIVKHNNNRFVVCIMENMGMCFIDIKKYDGGKSLVYTMDNWRDWTWVFNVKKYLEVIGNIHTSTQGVETKN